MKIIDAHEVQLKLLEECQNIRHFNKDRKKSQIFADGLDFAWVMLDNQPTVKAIPIEWIEEWGWKNGMSESMSLRVMIDDWEKENETNRQR